MSNDVENRGTKAIPLKSIFESTLFESPEI